MSDPILSKKLREVDHKIELEPPAKPLAKSPIEVSRERSSSFVQSVDFGAQRAIGSWKPKSMATKKNT